MEVADTLPGLTYEIDRIDMPQELSRDLLIRMTFESLPRGIVRLISDPADTRSRLADVLMSRYEKFCAVITSNRPIDGWPKLLGDVVVVSP